MKSETKSLAFTQMVKVPPVQVYYAFTNANALAEWLSDGADIEAHVGGRLYLYWRGGYYASGEYTVLEPGKRVAFTWHGRGEVQTTRVRIVLEAREEETHLTLTHAEIGHGESWDQTSVELKRGWERGLENLKSVLETGIDLRLTNRPVLGINIGSEMDAEQAAALGVPVSKGVRLGDPIEGLGAGTAGLQADDVIVEIGGMAVTGLSSLSQALSIHQVGDTVEVVFYRGAAKKRAQMKLSQRPVPKAPDKVEDLVEAARETYIELDTELNAIFKGVSETEASYYPAPGQWSAKETLAHLITSEQGLHMWIARLISGYAPASFNNNESTWVRAAAAAYPTIADLVTEMRRQQAITVTMLNNLPEAFVNRKGSYIRLAGAVLGGFPRHSRVHFAQMRAAIEATRKNETLNGS